MLKTTRSKNLQVLIKGWWQIASSAVITSEIEKYHVRILQALIESRVIVASTNFYVLQITRYRYDIEKKKTKNGKELRIKVASWSVIGATKGIVKSN